MPSAQKKTKKTGGKAKTDTRGPGRPELPEELRRRERTIRVYPSDNTWIEEHLKPHGISVSDFGADAIADFVKSGKADAWFARRIGEKD